MDQQTEVKTKTQNIGLKIVLAATVSALIAAIAAGSAVCFWKNRKIGEMKKGYERQIENLVGKNAAPSAGSDAKPANSTQDAMAAVQREEAFKKELAKKYDVSLSDVVSLVIEKETAGHLQGTFSYRASGGGEMQTHISRRKKFSRDLEYCL